MEAPKPHLSEILFLPPLKKNICEFYDDDVNFVGTFRGSWRFLKNLTIHKKWCDSPFVCPCRFSVKFYSFIHMNLADFCYIFSGHFCCE